MTRAREMCIIENCTIVGFCRFLTSEFLTLCKTSDLTVEDGPYKFMFYNLENLPRLRC
jgi:hypothetical protein